MLPSGDSVLVRPRLPFSLQLGVVVIAFRSAAIRAVNLVVFIEGDLTGNFPRVDA